MEHGNEYFLLPSPLSPTALHPVGGGSDLHWVSHFWWKGRMLTITGPIFFHPSWQPQHRLSLCVHQILAHPHPCDNGYVIPIQYNNCFSGALVKVALEQKERKAWDSEDMLCNQWDSFTIHITLYNVILSLNITMEMLLSSSFTEIKLTLQHYIKALYISLRFVTEWFDICIHCRKIKDSTHIVTKLQNFLYGKTFKSLSVCAVVSHSLQSHRL